MLLKLIIGLFMFIPMACINAIPVVNVVVPSDVLGTASTIFAYVGYFMPVDGLMSIILIGLALDNAHLVWSIVLRIKSFIPTMGD